MRVGDPIERWLELEGVFTIPGFGDVELADDLNWGAGRRHGVPAATERQPGVARRH